MIPGVNSWVNFGRVVRVEIEGGDDLLHKRLLSIVNGALPYMDHYPSTGLALHDIVKELVDSGRLTKGPKGWVLELLNEEEDQGETVTETHSSEGRGRLRNRKSA